MRNVCARTVDLVRLNCVKGLSLFTFFINKILVVEKSASFPTIFNRFFLGVFHSQNLISQSVKAPFLPTINIVNKNNNDSILIINNHCRRSV